jgi:TatD DNase family protein
MVPLPARLVDSHAHLQGPEFAGDLAAVIERARGAGVAKIIVVGGAGSLASSRNAIELARAHEGLFATVGMHPHDARQLSEADFDALSAWAREERVVAVGETGLDFHYEHSPREVQMELFARFIALARARELPLVVHSRAADREVIALLRREGRGEARGVLHCFTSDYSTARELLDLGFYISFSGIVTFKNAGPLRDVARRIPLERLLIETDAPYLAPVPHRGKRNEPAFVRLVADTLAQVKGIPVEELAAATSGNAKTLFGV